jgi:hypothetical protein
LDTWGNFFLGWTTERLLAISTTLKGGTMIRKSDLILAEVPEFRNIQVWVL